MLNAFGQVVRRNLPLELKNTRLTTEDILYVLGYALVGILFRLLSDLLHCNSQSCQGIS